MANPLPNETELYTRIKNEEITIAPEIWDLLYSRIGDDLSAINLLCQYYLSGSHSVPPTEAKKILNYTRHIKEMINQITLASKTDFAFPEFAQGMPLDPVLREMLTHYIGNDVYMINLIVGEAADPIESTHLSPENITKIICHCRDIKIFMYKLRRATMQVAAQRPKIEKEPAAQPKEPTEEALFARIRNLLAKEFHLRKEEITRRTRFKEDMGADAISMMEIIIFLEQEFNFEMPDEDEDQILNVGDAVEYVFNRMKKAS